MFIMVLLVLNILFVFPFLKIRYKKRERGKLVHAYSSSDVQGILVSWKNTFLVKPMSPYFGIL